MVWIRVGIWLGTYGDHVEDVAQVGVTGVALVLGVVADLLEVVEFVLAFAVIEEKGEHKWVHAAHTLAVHAAHEHHHQEWIVTEGLVVTQKKGHHQGVHAAETGHSWHGGHGWHEWVDWGASLLGGGGSGEGGEDFHTKKFHYSSSD